MYGSLDSARVFYCHCHSSGQEHVRTISRGQRGAPEGQEQGAGARTHLVVRQDVGVLPAHIADVAQQRVALLPPADNDGVRVDLRSTATLLWIGMTPALCEGMIHQSYIAATRSCREFAVQPHTAAHSLQICTRRSDPSSDLLWKAGGTDIAGVD